jgi:hypothetical protein
MDRITRRIDDEIIEFVDGKGYGNLSYRKGLKLLFERLLAYEDTGLSPEEINSLIKVWQKEDRSIWN